MPDPFYIGIDGGGSQSTILLIDKHNNELIRVKGGPTNPFSIGIDKTESVLTESIKGATYKANRSMADGAGICIGSAGVHHRQNAEDLHTRLSSHFPKTNIHVTNDYEIALVGGTGTLEGIILISGAGSVAYGRSRNHDFVRAGGWGHLIGDEGSAYYIGKQALISIFETCDTDQNQTLLEKMIMKRENCRDLDDLMFWAYKSATKKDIADLAIIVDKAYMKGDPTSHKILLNAANCLIKLLDNIKSRLLFSTEEIPMIISGGVLLYNDFVQSKFLIGVREKHPDICLVDPKNDAAFGAALIAQNFQDIVENKI